MHPAQACLLLAAWPQRRAHAHATQHHPADNRVGARAADCQHSVSAEAMRALSPAATPPGAAVCGPVSLAANEAVIMQRVCRAAHMVSREQQATGKGALDSTVAAEVMRRAAYLVSRVLEEQECARSGSGFGAPFASSSTAENDCTPSPPSSPASSSAAPDPERLPRISAVLGFGHEEGYKATYKSSHSSALNQRWDVRASAFQTVSRANTLVNAGGPRSGDDVERMLAAPDHALTPHLGHNVARAWNPSQSAFQRGPAAPTGRVHLADSWSSIPGTAARKDGCKVKRPAAAAPEVGRATKKQRSEAPAISALPSNDARHLLFYLEEAREQLKTAAQDTQRSDMLYVVPGEGAEKPMRRSRMLCDDARLALRLQKEEHKAAARGAKQLKASAPASAGSAAETQVRANRPGEKTGMQLLLDACMLVGAC